MNRLLNQLGSKFTVATFGDLFGRVGMNHIEVNHKVFVDAGEPKAAGLAKYDPRRIYINEGVTAIARVTTFELLHHAANRGSYDDHELDKAVINLMKPDQKEAANKQLHSKGYVRATIAHRALNDNCFNKGK